MEYKNKEYHNFSCEDREWLNKTLDLRQNLQKRNDEMNEKLKDMEKIIETKSVSFDNKDVQNVVTENFRFRREIDSKTMENERQRKEIIMIKQTIKNQEEQIKEMEAKESQELVEYRKTPNDKKRLLNEIRELELVKGQIEQTNVSLNSLKSEMIDFLKDHKKQIEGLEQKNGLLTSEIKKREKYLVHLNKNLFKSVGFWNQKYVRVLNKIERLIKKDKKDKARKIIAKVRMKLINLIGKDKDILLLRLEEIESRI